MTKPNNLLGRTFGYLEVLERAENDRFNKTRWLCLCHRCGNQKVINGSSLLRGLSKTCGCGVRAKTQERNDAKTIDETGHRYGMLTVISRNYEAKGRAMWNCHCDCGQDCVVSGKLLRSGWTKSCGCLQSKGELKIQQLLNALGLHYEKEKSFEDCRSPITDRKLFFDFYVEDTYLIEYDGIQHFEDARWKDDKDTFENKQLRDQVKNEYCYKNNIPLLRIPYWAYDSLTANDVILGVSPYLYEWEEPEKKEN